MGTTMTYWPVAEPLRHLVDSIYVFRSDVPDYRGLAGAILPQVQWPVAGEFAWVAHGGWPRPARGGSPQPVRAASAFGPTTAAAQVVARGPTLVVGTGFFPEGWASLMPMPAGSVTERVIDLDAAWGPALAAPLEGTAGMEDVALAALAEARLLARARVARPPDPRIKRIGDWANGTGHDIDALAAELSLCRRQLNRLSVAAVGLGPRLLANRHKILRMAAVLALGLHDNRREVWTGEYADQAHFIRNFRRFVGTTPSRFLSEPELLVRDVMRARFAIASDHPLGLASDGRVPAGQPVREATA